MPRPLRIFHTIVVLCAAATVIVSWPLWQTRMEPPLLPLIPLPVISTGFPLLAALAIALVRPPLGLAVYGAVLAYAIGSDWTRLQPAMISFGLLMAAGLATRPGIAIARTHLIALWWYAGLHKLLSPEFMAYRANVSPLRGLLTQPPPWLNAIYPEMVIVSEIGLAVAALIPRTRRLAAVWALGLHGTILLSLSPFGRNWNQTVWLWNGALAIAGFFLIAPWRERALDMWRAHSAPIRSALIFLAAFPLLSQLGIGDPYLAHHLYSRSTPISYVCRNDHVPPPRPGLGDDFTADNGLHCRFIDYFQWLDVPEPGEHAFAQAYFARTCASGEQLLIRERRWYFIATGQQWTQTRCGGSAPSPISAP